CSRSLQSQFAVAVCSRSLQSQFAVAVCSRSLQSQFAVAVCFAAQIKLRTFLIVKITYGI
ncbi:hypothetical protein, partial [Nonlabens antarcticus]|uniref:hypothetical protein n=1 Tax=Nonlabens antarcticus TaxID=392714 RepID=UPI0018918673